MPSSATSDGAIAREAARQYPQRYLSVKDAAAYLGYGSIDRIYVLIHEGLPAIRLGHGKGTYRLDRLKVDAWMSEREVRVHGAQSTRRVA